MLAESFVTLYRSRFPACYPQALREACAALAGATGRGSVSIRALSRWRSGEVPIPEDVADAMRSEVVGAWPGQFDRCGLLDAISLPDPAIRAAIKDRRNLKKPLATILQQS